MSETVDNDMFLFPKGERRLKLSRDIGGSKVFEFQHLPHLGLINPNPSCTMIPTMAFAGFNPESLDDIALIAEGDLIDITSDPTHRVYQYWNPPENLQIPIGFRQMHRVKHVVRDSIGFPLIITEAAN